MRSRNHPSSFCFDIIAYCSGADSPGSIRVGFKFLAVAKECSSTCFKAKRPTPTCDSHRQPYLCFSPRRLKEAQRLGATMTRHRRGYEAVQGFLLYEFLFLQLLFTPLKKHSSDATDCDQLIILMILNELKNSCFVTLNICPRINTTNFVVLQFLVCHFVNYKFLTKWPR